MQACLWHGLNLGLTQQRLDHVMAGRLLYKSILGAGMQELLRSVHMAQRAASTTPRQHLMLDWGSPVPSLMGLVTWVLI